MNEIWKTIDGFEDYKVSNLGRVMSYRKNKNGNLLNLYHNSDGYLMTHLLSNERRITIGVHRLVAKAFIPNPNNCLEVNHINTVRDDNRVENLEWTTHHDNVLYSAKLGNYSKRVGELNPNYHNDTLHKKLENNPELKMEYYSRPGTQNGRSQSIQIFKDDEFIKQFDLIQDCCKWINEHSKKQSKILSVHGGIWKSLKTNKPYKGYTFKLV